MNVNEEKSLIAFKAICNFIGNLESIYGKKHKPLKLYKRLINYTQISHDQIIKKHLTIFYDFCVANNEALNSSDSTKLIVKKLVYSERVYIDMDLIFRIADKENSEIIWKHLLTISAILYPVGKAKEILKKSEDSKDETDFLTNIIDKVEKNVKSDSNPMEAVSSLMQSGLISEMMSGIGSKNLDLGKLLGAVQGMVASLGNQVGDDPEAKQAIGMLSNMTSMMGNGGAPDMSGMMQMMTGMMAGMKPPMSKIEIVPEDKKSE